MHSITPHVSTCCSTASVLRSFAFACALAFTISGTAAFAEQLASPDGRIQVEIDLKNTKQLSQFIYRVSVDGDLLVEDSAVTFVRDDKTIIGDRLQFVSKTERELHDETWKPVYGERSVIRDHYNTQTFRYRDTNAKCDFTVEFRCYDSGVAFRSSLGTADSDEQLTIVEERTNFCFAADHLAWRTTSAQGKYDQVPLSKLGSNVERPLVIEASKQRYVAIGEAQLVDYAVMRLRSSESEEHCVVSQLQSEVRSAAPLTTPWRVLLIGDSPGQLLENNDLFLNLNEPCAIEDTSWIRPGKVLREVSLTTEGAKACIDFAQANGLQFVEFDAGWYGHEYDDASDATTITVDPQRSAGPLDLHWAIQYAADRDIGIILYVNRRALEKQLDDLLPLYKKWGVAGVKYGFVNTGSQKWTAWLHEAVRKAAEYQLMVDVHDEYRPTGYSRTYPNLMTQEGVRGDEATPSSSLAITTLFTRNLAGAADHTICYFDPRVQKNWSHAHQLAKAVCTYSPWQFVYWYDTPLTAAQDGKTSRSRIIDTPELEFFARVPTVWDETRVLHGAIGEYAVIARRSGHDWYIGAMNGATAHQLNVSLDFLKKNTTYQARTYRDDPSLTTKTQVAIEDTMTDSTAELTLSLLPNSGEAIHLTPVIHEKP